MADIQIMSFNAGELTPLVDGRSDLEKYYYGARVYENMIPTPYGPAERRPGTYFVAEVKDSTKKSRLVSFQYSTEQAYIVEFGDQYIRFCKDRGQIITGVGTEDLSALDHLVAHWKLNDDAATAAVDDAVAIVPHDGTASRNTNILSCRGRTDKGFDLGGTDYFVVDDHNELSFIDIGGTNEDVAGSIAAWIKYEDTGVQQMIISKSKNGFFGTSEWEFYVSPSGKLVFAVYDNSVPASCWIEAKNALTEGWHHVVVTYDGRGTEASMGMILYIDGVAIDIIHHDDTGGVYVDMEDTAIKVAIGMSYDAAPAPEFFWSGKLDNIAIFSDVVTASEVAGLFDLSIYEIPSSYLEADLFGLQHAQSADVLFNVHGDYPQSKLMRYAHDDWVLEDINFDWPPFFDENITNITVTPSATTGSITLTASGAIFTSSHADSYWLIKHSRTDNKIEHNFGADVGYSPILVDVKGSWRLRTSGTWTGKIEIQRTYDEQLTLVLNAAPAAGAWSEGDIITGAAGETCIIVSVTDSTHYVIKQLSGSFTDGEVLTAQDANARACDAGYPLYEGWHTIESFQSVDDQNFNVPGEEVDGNAYYRVECTAADDAALNIVLSCERYYHYGIVKITSVETSTSATATVLRTLGAATATKLWSEGAWSDERGYPVTTSFFEGRQFYAGTSYRPLDIWGSRVRDYENMDTGDKLDDDSVRFVVDSSMQNMIRWLVGQEVLLIGTAGGEWRLGSSDPADAITPTNPMRPRIQTTYGSKEIQALLLANAILFVDAQGRKVRGAQYIFERGEAGGYDAPDYTQLSEHITESGIVDMAYQQNPYPILWCVRDDGVLIGMLFEPGQKVWGWFRCVTDGDVESVAVIKGVTEDEVWIIVKREIGGTDKRYIEYFKPRDWGDDQADCYFVDSGLTFDGGDAVTITGITKADPGVITVGTWPVDGNGDNIADGDQIRIVDVVGMTDVNNKVFTVSNPNVGAKTFELRDKLDTIDWDTTGYDIYVSGGTAQKVDNTFYNLGHLEGETASVLGDGSVHDDVVVNSAKVILTDYFNKCHIGKGFTSSLMPMKLAVPGANIRGKKKRIHKIIFSFFKTLGAKFGTTEGSETIPFRKTTDPMGSPPPLFTGEKEQTFPGGYELNGDIYVEQTQPLPMTVRSITAKLGIYDE